MDNNYPNLQAIIDLTAACNLEFCQVKKWFENERKRKIRKNEVIF